MREGADCSVEEGGKLQQDGGNLGGHGLEVKCIIRIQRYKLVIWHVRLEIILPTGFQMGMVLRLGYYCHHFVSSRIQHTPF